MLRSALPALVFGLLVILPEWTAAQPDLRLHGSNTVGEELAPALIRGWLESEGYSRIEETETAPLERLFIGVDPAGETLTIELHAHGSSTGFRGLASGRADLGMSSRRIRQQEVEQLSPMGRLDDARHEFVIGIDGLAVIVHPSNPIDALSIEQIRGVFSGRIDNWARLGGPNLPIRRYARDEQSGTFDSFDSMVMQDAALARDSERFESSSELSDRVSRDPGGIGFIGLPYIDRAKALSVSAGGAAVPPERFSSATEDYPLSRRLYLYVPEDQIDGPGGRLADFAVSRAGQARVDEIGFVGQAIEIEQLALPEDAPSAYREYVRGAWRASMNFRFEPQRAVLDSKSRRDLDRLIDHLNQVAERPYEVLLMGFADPSETSPYFSLSLSNDRVQYVAEILARAGLRVPTARGFGDALPLAEGTGESAAAKNRRVEVWLRPIEGSRQRRNAG
ncbi:MAG: phosphate ABC transporter substrate-binding/OmpA family protein [Wenzhouxiangella sp.]|jgi:phosphate transport system substrate-binding protein|nr:phosphate ABC transporter substrate-binding/OmpA family protein [Wenzhouxiangella sp.]